MLFTYNIERIVTTFGDVVTSIVAGGGFNVIFRSVVTTVTALSKGGITAFFQNYGDSPL
jgi:hypothetical protein